MAVHGLRNAIIAIALLGLMPGCRGVPPIPEHVRARGYNPKVPEEGWLYRQLTGQEMGSAEPATSSGVEPASAVEPIPPDAASDGASVSSLTAARRSGQGPILEPTEDDEGFTLDDLSPGNVAKRLKELAGYGPDEELARALYQEGETLYQQKQYAEAAKKFEAAADRWPDSTLEEDALFMLGESCFFADLYPKANDAYSKLLSKYEYTKHLDTTVNRLFAIGRYWEQLDATDPAWHFPLNLTDSSRPVFDTFGYGIKAFEAVRLHDPTGPLADDSIMAAANAHFVRGSFEEAAYHYDLIRSEYPRSEHQLNAHLLGMKSKLELYQGPMYEGSPLEDAKKIADQALTQFGHELGDERKHVIETRNRLVEEQAMRDWSIGQYYDRKAYYGAARYYYQAILDEHPRTVAARLAEKRLKEIEGLPDEPPNHFKWLTDLFPEEN